jgi:hypothetical protein
LNEIKITILESGAVKIETGQISASAHSIAEKALLWINQEMGGESQRLPVTHTHNQGEHHEHI